MKSYVRIVLYLLVLIERVSAAKILALMVVASHSHHLWNSKYLEALAERGHQITYLGLDEYKTPSKNITHIFIRGVYEFLYRKADLTSLSDAGPYKSTLIFRQWEEAEAEFTLKSEALEVLNRVIRAEKFDLVVHDIASNPYLLGAIDILGKPPVIGITAYGVPTLALEILGNPMAFSSKPYFYAPYSDRMTFTQRVNNYFFHLFSFGVRWFSMRKQNDYSKKCFGKGVRPLDQILDDINIILVNINYGLDYVFPKVAGLIPVGGLHVQKPQPLPQDLEAFLNEANEGAVYFSLGSNVKSSKLSKEIIHTLVQAFKEISPVKVLWKWELGVLPGKPENVKIQKWLPQNDILAHPNVRLFFTHSGMLSIQEAIYHGKPIVGLPFFLDQHVNLKKCVDRGFGEALNIKKLTVQKIVKTIKKILNDDRYAKNAKKASEIFRDEIESPLERAIYWTEYAIRHKGAPHFRHSARNLSWCQNWMLDVILLLISSLIFLVLSIYKLFFIYTWRFCGHEAKSKKN